MAGGKYQCCNTKTLEYLMTGSQKKKSDPSFTVSVGVISFTSWSQHKRKDPWLKTEGTNLGSDQGYGLNWSMIQQLNRTKKDQAITKFDVRWLYLP